MLKPGGNTLPNCLRQENLFWEKNVSNNLNVFLNTKNSSETLLCSLWNYFNSNSKVTINNRTLKINWIIDSREMSMNSIFQKQKRTCSDKLKNV